MATPSPSLSSAGIVSDLSQLLRSRHWAQRLSLFSRQAARNMMLGNVRSRFRGRGMEFEEVRRYQPGDDIRTIDWKVSARAEGTYTKLFCEERERPCHILVDQRSPLYFGSTRQFKSVLAAELGAALAWAALAGGDRVGGQVVADFDEKDTRARRNRQAVLNLIHDIHEANAALQESQNQSQQDTSVPSSLGASLEECQRITRPGTAIFIVSDFHDFDQRAAKALSNLGKHTDLSLLQVMDPLEESLPLLSNVAISDGRQNRRVTISKRIKSDYLEQRAAQQVELKKAIGRARALYSLVSTKDSARSALISIFGR